MAKKSGKTRATRRKSANKTAHRGTKAAAAPAPLPQPPPKPPAQLPNAWQLTKAAALTLWAHKELFAGIILVYGLLNLILVQGLASSTDVGSLKNSLDKAFTGHLSSLASSLGTFVVLIGGAGSSSSQTGGSYQSFLALAASLAIIWALRQVLAGTRVRVRDAYYRGMYPLVPFLLILMVIAVQVLPLLAGSLLYTIVAANGIAVYFIEKCIWAAMFGALALWSLYMITASAVALYIVTLPDVTPLQALRSARELLRGRRWTVLRKILCLPLILFVIAAVIMLPIIVWLTPLAQGVFFLLAISALGAVHAYMYTLYRELLK